MEPKRSVRVNKSSFVAVWSNFQLNKVKPIFGGTFFSRLDSSLIQFKSHLNREREKTAFSGAADFPDQFEAGRSELNESIELGIKLISQSFIR